MAKWTVRKTKSLQEHHLVANKQSATKLAASIIINILMLATITYLVMKGF